MKATDLARLSANALYDAQLAGFDDPDAPAEYVPCSTPGCGGSVRVATGKCGWLCRLPRPARVPSDMKLTVAPPARKRVA